MKLVHPVGTKIVFSTTWGQNPGRHEGVIKHRMIANPNGFIPQFDGFYDVEVFLPRWGQHVLIAVTPEMIEKIKT